MFDSTHEMPVCNLDERSVPPVLLPNPQVPRANNVRQCDFGLKNKIRFAGAHIYRSKPYDMPTNSKHEQSHLARLLISKRYLLLRSSCKCHRWWLESRSPIVRLNIQTTVAWNENESRCKISTIGPRRVVPRSEQESHLSAKLCRIYQAPKNNIINETHPTNHWIQAGSWPKECFESAGWAKEQFGPASSMNLLQARQRSSKSTRRQINESSYATPSDQKPRGA